MLKIGNVTLHVCTEVSMEYVLEWCHKVIVVCQYITCHVRYESLG